MVCLRHTTTLAWAIVLAVAVDASGQPAPPKPHPSVLHALQEQVRAAREARRLRPSHAGVRRALLDVLTRLSTALLAEGRPAQARPLIEEALSLEPDAAPSLYVYALVFERLGRHIEAKAWLERLLGGTPDHPAARILLAEVLFALQDYRGSARHYSEALKTFPDHPALLTGLALAQSRLGDKREAVAMFRRALGRSPQEPTLWANLAQALLDLDEPAEAIDCYREAFRRGYTDVEARVNAAIALRKLGRLDQAQVYAEDAVRSAPSHARARYELCLLAVARLDLAAALLCLSTYERDFPHDYQAPYLEAEVLERLGRLQEAETALRRALRMGYPAREAHEALARLRARISGPAVIPGPSIRAGPRPSTGPWLVDVAVPRGLAFRHHAGLPALWLPQVIGAGVAIIDYDGDGAQDVYLVNGYPTGARPGGAHIDWRRFFEGAPRDAPGHALFRQSGGGALANVTALAGAGGQTYGMGVCAGDIDSDGHLDLVVTGKDRNLLLANMGDGTFREIGLEAGVGHSALDTGASLGDLDGDGRPDLYLAAYAAFTPDDLARIPQTYLTLFGYEHLDTTSPGQFPPAPSRVLRNSGDRTFEDVTAAWGGSNNENGQGKALGCMIVDTDADGRLDVYVANDTRQNSLYRNLGGGRLVNVASREWVDDARGSMGLAIADYDGDGLLDLFVTNWVGDTCGLYQRRRGLFLDATDRAGLATLPLTTCGWGTAFVDVDLDGWSDLVWVNGDTTTGSYPPIRFLTDPRPLTAQPWRVMHNRGDGTFEDLSEEALGAGFTGAGRGLAAGDLDADGRVELVVQVHEGEARLLSGGVPTANRWVLLELVGTRGPRDAVGAVVEVETRPGRRIHRQLQPVVSGGSFLSQSSLRMHFGLGEAVRVEEVRVRWAGGSEAFGPLDAGRVHRIVEGRGRPVGPARTTAPGGAVPALVR